MLKKNWAVLVSIDCRIEEEKKKRQKAKGKVVVKLIDEENKVLKKRKN